MQKTRFRSAVWLLASLLCPTIDREHIIEPAPDSIASTESLSYPLEHHFPPLGSGPSHDVTEFLMPLCNGFKLEEASIDELQQAMVDGRLTSVQIVICYLRRIQQTDKYLQAIMEINPDVLDIAAALDTERKLGRIRGPLHGIPFLVKDNIATKDSMETTAGSWALLGSIVPRDAFVVQKLRNTGAVLLGHATMSEWADMRSNIYSEGYSARGGQCRSPYNLTVNPGGSSSGSGVAVGANMVTFALGTETDGSIISPADRNAIVGIKPTVGLTSRDGTIPESHNQDTIGCFAKSVRDATYCLDAVYGPDVRDNYTLVQQTPANGYAPFLSTASFLHNASFGIPWITFWQYASPYQRSLFLKCLSIVESAGARIVNNTELVHSHLVSPYGWDWDYGTVRGYPNESEYTVIKVDFYNDISRYLSELDNTNIRSLEDIMKYNIDNIGTEGGLPNVHPAFASGQDGFDASVAMKGIMDKTYWQALSYIRRTFREEGIDAALYNNGDPVDALLVPSHVAQASNVAAQAGYPMISIPFGIDPTTGMPVGLSLIGTAWSEGTLIELASAIEDLLRKTPYGRSSEKLKPTWWGYRKRNIPVNNV